MEEMIGQRMRPLLSLSEFLAQYKEISQVQPCIAEDNDEYMERLEEVCSLSKLEDEADPLISEYVPGFSEHIRKLPLVVPHNTIKLSTFENLHKQKNKSIKNPFQRTRDSAKCVSTKKCLNETSDLTSLDELLIWIRIYRPARATHIGQTLEKPVFDQEFVCLGSNYLTELRDKISCICNGKRFLDISDNPKQAAAGKKTDPAFFFITNTFYNDKRNKNNCDYSETIRNWKDKTGALKNERFYVGSMESTRFLDLKVSLGFPQLYQHHGNCEHVFTFSQVELLTENANKLPRAMYPQLVSFSLFNDRVCHMCGNMQFVIVVEGSNRQLHDPAYLCENCFMRYHYINGKKIGKFQAYRLKDDNISYKQELPSEHVVGEVWQHNKSVEESKEQEKPTKDINKRKSQKSKENKTKQVVKNEAIKSAASCKKKPKQLKEFKNTMSDLEIKSVVSIENITSNSKNSVDLDNEPINLIESDEENAEFDLNDIKLANTQRTEETETDMQQTESWSYVVQKVFSEDNDELEVLSCS